MLELFTLLLIELLDLTIPRCFLLIADLAELLIELDPLLEDFFDEALLDDLIIEFFLLLLEALLELDFLLDELFTLEILLELDFLLEAFFNEALLDDLIIELFLLDASLKLFAELLIELDLTLELFTGRLPPR